MNISDFRWSKGCSFEDSRRRNHPSSERCSRSNDSNRITWSRCYQENRFRQC